MKAGGCGFESHLSNIFSMKIEKRALRFIALLPLKSKFTYPGGRIIDSRSAFVSVDRNCMHIYAYMRLYIRHSCLTSA